MRNNTIKMTEAINAAIMAAGVVGKSESNVKVLLYRAREELKKNMEVFR